MSILVEAYTIILRISTIEEKFPGGMNGFVKAANATLRFDEEIAGMEFMAPEDVMFFIRMLQRHGLKYFEDEKFVDIALVCQIRGLLAHCDWLQFGHWTFENNIKVPACRLVGSKSKEFVAYRGWQYERSISSRFDFWPEDIIDRCLKFLRHENDMDIYLNLQTGEEVYIGRDTGRINNKNKEHNS